ncbi:MAG TPA: peptidyl-prolyl cis-trans isomerase [Paracoccaceae bacterium]
MAKPTQTDSPIRKRKGASIVVWILMAMLVAGLGGFGITNYGSGVTAIGQVGDREIDVNQYARALQQEVAALGAQVGSNVTLQQALTLGLDRQVRQRLVTTAALDNESDRVGISVGDARVAAEITEIPAFRGATGRFDRETYRFTLENNNLSEAEFEKTLRDDLSRALLQGAVAGGFVAPAPLTDTLYAYIAERRGLTLLRLTEADLPAPLAAPTEAELQAHYDANIAAFTRPEAKRITYAALLPETLAGKMPVDDAALRALYDERIDEFVQPERRLVERLVYPTEAEAAAAKARLDAGESFETLVAERGLTLDDIDLGDVSPADLGAAGAAVFALTEPGVVGPSMTDLGPALFRMNAVLAAQEVPFEEARETLVAEFQQDAARRDIADRIEAIDDALAGGAPLEELAAEFGMTLETLDFSSASEDRIVGYPAFREAASKVAAGDFPEAITLDDGGVVALRLDATVPAAPIPLDQARDAVTESWRAAAVAKALAARAAEIKAEVEAGASLGAYGILSVTPEISREGFIENTPPDFLATVFAMAEGELRVIDAPEFSGLVRLDRILPASGEGDEAAALKAALNAQVEQALAQDAFALFSNAISQDAGITLNEAAINAVHAQFR